MVRCGRTASLFQRKFHAQIPEAQAAQNGKRHLTARGSVSGSRRRELECANCRE